MSKNCLYLVSITLLSLAAANICGAATVPFSVRASYDAQVANDGSQGPNTSDSGSGTHVRDIDTRRRVTLVSFDVSSVKTPGSKFSDVTLSVIGNQAGTMLVYGVIESQDNISGNLTWNTAPGVQNNPTPAVNTAVALDLADLVGPLMTFTNIPSGDVRVTSPASQALADFMNTDTDGTITLLFAPPAGGNVILRSSVRWTSTSAGTFLAGNLITADQYAGSPKPADKATDVSRDATISWTPGKYAATHDVYFGTVFADVNTADRDHPKGVLAAQGQDANTYDPPGHLAFGQTYYWRIDEVNGPPTNTIFKGDVWSFTVEPEVYQLTGITASASSYEAGKGPENTINSSGLDSTGLLHSTDSSAMWLTNKTATGAAWIQYDFGRVYKLREMWVWNYNIDFEFLLGLGIKNAKIEYSADAATWTTLGNFDFAQGASAAGYAHNTTVNFGGAAVKRIKITVNSVWGTSGQCGLSEVRFFYVPVSARQPQPATGATGIAPDVTLGWRAGREASSHKVCMGTDPNVLTLAGTVTGNSYAPANLGLGTTYYWRVDEVNTAEAISTWAGDVWSFTTNPYIVVDDMESYNETTPTRIFDVWVDGYNTTTNGSQVGYDTSANGTFGETTIIHGGRQSMPLKYNNSGSIATSEATRTFDSAQDWTRSAVKTLTLYFYGDPNSTGSVSLWVKVTDQNGKSAKVTFGTAAGEDPTALVDRAWTEWDIPLSSLTGLTLTKIKSMTIGVGGSGSGRIFIDDIRLTPAVPPPVAPVLVGWWKLDNDAKDSSGNANNGTLVGAPTYVAAGKIGAALSLNGTADYVDCGNGASLNITDKVTLSAWIKPNSLANSTHQDFVGKGDSSYSLKCHSSNYIQFFVYAGSVYHNANSAVLTSAFNGTWHHVAGTFDGAQVKLYVDGQLVAGTLYAGAIGSATYNVNIGHNSQQTTRFYNGLIDDVRIYQGALSKSDVLKLANP